MEHIVEKYAKIDLHIHTSASKKDGKIVSNNTPENIEKILLPKLIKNEVNMVALTDHNVFSMTHYKKLKEFENQGELKKVLPGVEFDVTKHKHRFHVIVIFDDSDIKKIENIQIVLNKFNRCFKDGAYSFVDFVKILDEFKMPCLTIAHQKSDPKGGDHNQDLSGVGYDNFKNELYIDYFDSLEFASLDTEGFLKLRKVEDNLTNLRYITGSDCHDWNYYPSKDEEFHYTYIKALPSFMGLVMALTEFNRVNLDGGKMNSPILECIDYKYNGESKKIKLSSGINVIIGDNSIGKSAILESLFNKKVYGYHKQYLTENGFEFTYLDNLKNKTLYNGQGSIRKKFEKSGSKLEDDKAIKQLFKDINIDIYKEQINENVKKFVNYLKYNDQINEAKESIDTFLNVPTQDIDAKYPSFSKLDTDNGNVKIDQKIAKISQTLHILKELIDLESNENIRNRLIQVTEELKLINNIYLDEQRKYRIKSQIIARINRSVMKIEGITSQLKSDVASTKDEFDRKSEEVISNYCGYIKKILKKNQIPKFETLVQNVEPNLNGNYEFYSSIAKTEFTQNDFEAMILDLVDNKKIKNYSDLENMSLDSIPLNGFDKKGDDQTKEDYFYSQCNSYIKRNVLSKRTYIQLNNEKIESRGYSAGKNALIYLDIIKDSDNTNLLVFDQPEDDVAQNKIATDLIDILNFARKKKQIIFITHNPQLVVNLDVDNVIILEQDEKSNIDIKYGALEYEGDEKILDKVAEMLDGGKEVLRKRWRRYGKQK